ncbi:hypothetical protein [Acinetobacter sp. c3-l95]|uniref:hypothetical protein n=1 Tax=Acinetobacter sp. c3-l95 TaxID=3342804 RepID=UPI0035B8C772
MLNQHNTLICLALMAISHNGVLYNKDQIIALNENDKLFLEKAGYVREATAEEIALANAQQNQQSAEQNPSLPTVAPEDAVTTVSASTETATEPAPAVQDVTDSQATDDVNTDEQGKKYSKLNKAQLVEELTTRAIEHDATAKNADLIDLLVTDDSNKASQPSEPAITPESKEQQ